MNIYCKRTRPPLPPHRRLDANSVPERLPRPKCTHFQRIIRLPSSTTAKLLWISLLLQRQVGSAMANLTHAYVIRAPAPRTSQIYDRQQPVNKPTVHVRSNGIAHLRAPTAMLYCVSPEFQHRDCSLTAGLEPSLYMFIQLGISFLSNILRCVHTCFYRDSEYCTCAQLGCVPGNCAEVWTASCAAESAPPAARTRQNVCLALYTTLNYRAWAYGPSFTPKRDSNPTRYAMEDPVPEPV